MAQVFVCYSRKDRAFVDQLTGDLKAAGIPIWRDLEDIPTDVRSNTSGWRDAVDRGLRESSHMLVVLSPGAVASEEVKAEWNYFLAQRRTVYPVLCAECEIPYRLYALNYYDFRGDYATGLAGLISALPSGESAAPPEARPRAIRPVWMAIIGAIGLAAIVIGAIIAGGLNGASPSTETPAPPESPTPATTDRQTSETPADPGTPTATPDPLVISIANIVNLKLRPALKAHTDFVRAVQWSPDGTRLASASRDGTVILWTLATGEQEVLSNHTGWVNDVAWSPPSGPGDPGGARVVSAGADSRIVEWDATNGRKIRPLTGQEGAIYGAAWSPDGKLLASGAEDGTAVIRNAGNGAMLLTLNVESPVYAIAWSPDSATLATSGPNSAALLWDAQTGAVKATLTGHKGAIYGLAWSRANNTLASASADKTVIVWDTETNKAITPLIGHADSVYAIAWSPDGKLLATVSADNSMIVWNAATGSPLRRVVGHEGPVTSVAWSPDGKTIVSGSWDMTIAVWGIGEP